MEPNWSKSSHSKVWLVSSAQGFIRQPVSRVCGWDLGFLVLAGAVAGGPSGWTRLMRWTVGGQATGRLSAIGAAAGDDDLIVGEPRGGQLDHQFEGQFRLCATIGSCSDRDDLSRPSSPPFFFPLVRPWRLRYRRMAMGKAKTLVGAEKGVDEDQDRGRPIVSPARRGDLARLEMSGS